MLKNILLLIFLVLSIIPGQSQNTNIIRNLVFEGGGIRGIAYAGALSELQNRKVLDSITRVAGTSAGAIAATLFAVGYTSEEISKAIYELEIKSMADGRWIFIGGATRVVRKYGWYRGDNFTKWIGALIKKKTGKENLSFRELYELSLKDPHFKQLFLTGTNLSQQRLTIFSKETYPFMEVRNAVRVSMGIPLFYKAVVLDNKGVVIHKKRHFCEGDVYVDGGIIGNFPIHIFDYKRYMIHGGDSTPVINSETLGLRLDTDEQISHDRSSLGLAPRNISGFRDYVDAFYNLMLENLNRQNLTKEDWKRTVSISTVGIAPKVRKMSVAEKESLIGSGRRGVREYFEGK
jgi:NTE family protein